jgi:hypothetical protein
MAEGCKHIVPLSFADAVKEVGRVERQPRTARDGPLYSTLLAAAEDVLKDKKFWKIKYSYGDLVINKGNFTLPGVDTNCSRCREMQEEYARKKTVPLLLNLDKNLEIFLICTDRQDIAPMGVLRYRTVPVSHRTPGEFIGLFESLRPLIEKPAHYGPFYVSAGSRNIHLVLPLGDGSGVIEGLFGNKLDSDPLDGLRAEDCRQYGLAFQKDGRIASHWRLVKKLRSTAKWEASLLLLPQEIVCTDAGTGETQSSTSARELLLKLLLEAWGQAQDALEAFVAEDEPHLPGKPYFLNIEDASVPTVLRHLTNCVDGKAFLHCPARNTDANGPFPAFLRWAAAIKDTEQDYYIPLILEPRRLDCTSDEDFGFVSMIHPLIAKSLRFTERPWTPSKLTASLTPELNTRNIEHLIQIYATATVKNLKRLGCEDMRVMLRGLVKDESGAKVLGQNLNRDRCLKIFMKVKPRKAARQLRKGAL